MFIFYFWGASATNIYVRLWLIREAIDIISDNKNLRICTDSDIELNYE